MRALRGFAVLYVLVMSPYAYCAGYTNWATPTNMELVYGGSPPGFGLLISGAFGDLNACGVANYIYVPQSNGAYKDIVAMVLAAMTAGREMQFYTNSCVPIPFHWASGSVINVSMDGDGPSFR